MAVWTVNNKLDNFFSVNFFNQLGSYSLVFHEFGVYCTRSHNHLTPVSAEGYLYFSLINLTNMESGWARQ